MSTPVEERALVRQHARGPRAFSVADLMRAAPGLGLPFFRSWLKAEPEVLLLLSLAAITICGALGVLHLWMPVVFAGYFVLGWWLFLNTIDIFLATTYTATIRKHFAPDATGRAPAEVTCPRCSVFPRTGSGWCMACSDLLHAGPTGPAEIVARHYRAEDARDRRAFCATLAPTITSHQGKTRITESAARNWRRLRTQFVAFADTTSVVELAVGDPDDAQIVWARVSTRFASHKRGVQFTARRIERFRLAGGRIAEATSAEPLAEAGDVPPRGEANPQPLWTGPSNGRTAPS